MFVSNIALSHCANNHAVLTQNEVRTFRGYMKPTVPGALSWRFIYQNTVDSTWDDGAFSRANLPGGHFEIVHAEVCACDENLRILTIHTVTFSGSVSASVSPGALVATDPVRTQIPPHGYIMFQWCIRALDEYTVLPGTPDSRGLCYTADREVPVFAPHDTLRFLDGETEECSVLPNLWQVNRPVRSTMAFIGDSITQGCQTRVNQYEQWASRIIRGLPEHIAGVNIGLGYARAQDAAGGGAWLRKLKDMDVVNVCLGVNDIFQMTEREDHADVLARNLEFTVLRIKNQTPKCKVVLFTIPPFSMVGDEERVRQEVNARIRETKLGADAVFDMEMLAVPGTQGQSRFGEHPDGIGGAVVAGEYLTRFLPDHPFLF